MTENLAVSRRSLVKLLGGSAIALPLARMAWSDSAMAADAVAKVAAGKVRFYGMAAPGLDNPESMAQVTVGSKLGVDGGDASQAFELSYEAFFKTGDKVPGPKGEMIVAGGYYDIEGRPIMDTSVPGESRQMFSDCPDGMSLLQPMDGVDKAALGVKGNPVFAVVQFEYTSRNLAKEDLYGRLPSPLAVMTFDQNPETGALKLVRYSPVPAGNSHGLWITCGASRSPWNTHLSSEEYPTDAFAAEKSDQFHAFITNLYGDAAAVNDPAKANPYLYNHIPEVKVSADGSGTVTKHFCLGRISHELVQVCPDSRTVLMGDDMTNGGAFMFVADKAEDLSSGTLYVAKWKQTSGEGPGAADLSWIKLGHATSDEVEQMAKTLKPTDIMDVVRAEPTEAGFTKIFYEGKPNWVRLKPGMEKAAAFLETHRYAALRGGSLGFTKWEGTTVNAADKVAYVAMSSIKGPMKDGSTDIHVQGPTSGSVYALDLRDGQQDDQNQTIDSAWVPVHMAGIPALTGEDLKAADEMGNLANADRVANPDNIKFSEDMRTLFVGEDSGMHVNNFLWAYNVDDKSCVRVLSTPSGAESTGLQSVDNVNGWTYIMSNFQHPGDWEKGLHDKVKDVLTPLINKNFSDRYAAQVGYIAGMRQLKNA
ncbi:PhoX family protein [Radicibacter daui]|uniref:PhoX family protein n=1 Tax=Radicibacter daui TaxID=3064829 RepID=UPI004046B8EE